jgi:hypothetical protein
LLILLTLILLIQITETQTVFFLPLSSSDYIDKLSVSEEDDDGEEERGTTVATSSLAPPRQKVTIRKDNTVIIIYYVPSNA